MNEKIEANYKIIAKYFAVGATVTTGLFNSAQYFAFNMFQMDF